MPHIHRSYASGKMFVQKMAAIALSTINPKNESIATASAVSSTAIGAEEAERAKYADVRGVGAGMDCCHEASEAWVRRSVSR